MDNLELIIYEYVLGFCLQGMILIFGIYTFNRQKIIFNKFVLASILFILSSYLVRLLPLSFGVHTLINMIILVIICILLLKMPAFNTIRSMSIVMVLLLISEMIGLVIASTIMGKVNFENAMHNPIEKAILGIPVNILFFIVIALSYYLLKKKGDFSGKISS